MKPFKVVTQDPSCGYTFDYMMKAGDPVVPPYPLNEAIGATPPAEIFGKNVLQIKIVIGKIIKASPGHYQEGANFWKFQM
jgi:hypothetical protein